MLRTDVFVAEKLLANVCHVGQSQNQMITYQASVYAAYTQPLWLFPLVPTSRAITVTQKQFSGPVVYVVK